MEGGAEDEGDARADSDEDGKFVLIVGVEYFGGLGGTEGGL